MWLGQTRAPHPSKTAAYDVETVAEGLSGAFCFDFLPDGRMIVGERPGRIRIVAKDGKLSEPLGGMPADLWAHGQGLFEVRPDRAFADEPPPLSHLHRAARRIEPGGAAAQPRRADGRERDARPPTSAGSRT